MILVTGATGRPGSAVIREFARHGTQVRALARDRAKAAALRGLAGVDGLLGMSFLSRFEVQMANGSIEVRTRRPKK